MARTNKDSSVKWLIKKNQNCCDTFWTKVTTLYWILLMGWIPQITLTE
jgi:hypothetical protein